MATRIIVAQLIVFQQAAPENVSTRKLPDGIRSFGTNKHAMRFRDITPSSREPPANRRAVWQTQSSEKVRST